jgi:riboflavin-specific deaminase-like protein
VALERIYPDPARLTPDEVMSGLKLGDSAPAERPYLVLNMVASTDGKAAVEGRSGPLGDETDRQLFLHLRTQADAVMVGAGTLRAERYGRMVRDPALRAKREREGLDADPLAVVVSGRLELPRDLPLLNDPDSRVVVVTSSDARLEDCAAQIEYMRTGEPMELAPALGKLRSSHGVRSILCEGGPTLNRSLLAEGLVDELFLSISPMLVGGSTALTIVAGMPLEAPAQVNLVWLLAADDSLYLRSRVHG